MSHEALQWAFAQDVDEPSARHLLLELANCANGAGRCFPSQETLAARTRLSVRSVKSHLAWLEERGLIARERRTRRNGSRTSDEYRLAYVQNLHLGGEEDGLGAKSAPTKVQKLQSLGAKSAPTYSTEPVSEPVRKKESPMRKRIGPYPADFEKFWQGYPRRSPNASKSRALAAWQRLAEAERAEAAAMMPRVLRWLAHPEQRNYPMPHPAKWLEERRYEGFAEQAAAEERAPAPAALVRIELGTPQWTAWRAHLVAAGKRTAFMDAQGRKGEPYWVPSEWPPGYRPTAPPAATLGRT